MRRQLDRCAASSVVNDCTRLASLATAAAAAAAGNKELPAGRAAQHRHDALLDGYSLHGRS